MWNRLRITLRTSDLDANSRTLEEYRQSHPVVEIEESDLLPDEGESPLSHDESELEIALVPNALQESIESEIERIVDADHRFGTTKEYALLMQDLRSTGGESISIRSYLWLVGWSNTGGNRGPTSENYVQPLTFSMFGYVLDPYLIIDGKRFDLKKYRYDSKRFMALDESIVAYHRDHLGGEDR